MNVTELVRVAKVLHRLGHAPEFKELSAQFLEWALSDGLPILLSRYQRFHGLAVTGQLDAAVTDHLARPRCAHPDVMPVTGGAVPNHWGLDTLHYFQSIAYPGVDPARVAANYLRATRLLSAVCGMAFQPTPDASAAQIVATAGTIDGPWNVLAISELPPAPGFAGTLHQTFDRAEQLDDDTMVAMMAHELGHIIGSGHLAAGNLMAPVLDPAIRSPQPGDVAVFQALAGPPRVPATPPAPPEAAAPPPPANPSVEAEPFELEFTVPAPGTYILTFGPTLAKKVST